MGISHFLFLLFLSFSSYFQPCTSSSPHDNSTDLESLLSFKSQTLDPLGILSANWTAATSYCSWIGVTCADKHPRVASLDLYNFSLQGTISPRLGNLSFLSYLDLSLNSLTGAIPQSLTRLSRLTLLALEDNLLTGPIPVGVVNMSSLITLSLVSNHLSGSLPPNTGFFMLPNIQLFSVSLNRLTGEIPSSFARCQNLQQLSLSNNLFGGAIPIELGYLPRLTELTLSGNQLTGKIPSSLGNLTELTILDLNRNSLDGEIPDELGNLKKLGFLNLATNGLTGSIPMGLLNASSLTNLSLSFNNLTGPVPAALGGMMPRLEVLYLEANQLSGGFEFLTPLSGCENLTKLDILNNQLDGVLPDSVGNLSTRLQWFNMAGNRIKGGIPSAFGNLSSLLLLQLGTNELTGEIPVGLARAKTLQVLVLSRNQISGPIPSELGLLTGLNNLDLRENALSGPIPSALGNISGLQTLSLAANSLSSSIPKSLGSLGGLLVLNLARNMLNGLLPIELGNMEDLDLMDLSANQFSGNIPPSLGEMQKISYLDLSNNSFQGQIPRSFGKLINVGYMNLSHNLLSGTIPDTFVGLRYLTSLDLSFNKLEGQIPNGTVFSNSTAANLTGNEALCGATKLGFPACSTKHDASDRGKHRLLKYILPSIASGVIILASLGFILRCYLRRESKIPGGPDQTDPLYSNDHRLISHYELVRATDNFSESNLLGRGGYSSVYKACLDDGLVTAVKILNLEVEGASKSFDVECRTLSMLRHRNLVKIISTCSNPDFKALILQFMPNGNLDKWLHSENHRLNFLQRMNVMVDVSSALEHLHHHHHSIVVHCDLKPNNVLLDENMIAYVGDFGIAKLLAYGAKSLAHSNAPGTIGYIAPEYGSTGNVTRRSDVYSFGILLLETFTGKKPTDAMFSGELNLRRWVSSAYPDDILRIVDSNLFITDSIDILQSEFLASIMLSIIELGLLCSRDLPNERLLMMDVVPSLEKIKMDYLLKFPDVVA